MKSIPNFPMFKVMRFDLSQVHDLPHGSVFGFFLFPCFIFVFFFIFLFPLDVEVIVYKAGSVTDVRNGELCKVDLDVFDGSMPPGETVVKCSGSFLCLMLFRCPFHFV